MNITAIFPSGMTAITVNGLHQWDYGRKLEIRADDLPAIIEVHFSCIGMEDAVVRTCAVEDGRVEVAIPDQCLEQTSPITAWVYEIGDTFGATAKTITLTVIPRTRPQSVVPPSMDVPNKYTDALVAVNTAARVLDEKTESAKEEIEHTVEDAVVELNNAAETATEGMEEAVAAVLGGDVLVTAAKSLVAPRIFEATVEEAKTEVSIDEEGLYLVIFAFEGAWGYRNTSAVISVYDIGKSVKAFGGFPDQGTVAGDYTKSVHIYYDAEAEKLFAATYNPDTLVGTYYPILEVYKIATFTKTTT